MAKKDIEQIAREDGRYNPKAFKFVYDGLGYSIENLTQKPGHITGQTLCEGLKLYAVKKWGRLAKLVLNNWGIKTTRDFGEIVYLMIENEWMNARPEDSITDFDCVYNFRTAFVDEFIF